MTSQLPTSNLLVRLISQKFRQLVGQPVDLSNDNKPADNNHPTMGSFDGASPFLPPPTLDVNPAKFDKFDKDDEYVQGIMDEILTDEAEYDRSFDEYSGTRPASIERGDEQPESGSEGTNVAGEPADTEGHSEKTLPYSSPCPSYKRQKLQQVEQASSSSESGDKSESESDSDPEAASSSDESSSEDDSENAGDECDDKREERELEEFILESLSFTQREEFLHFLKYHPFIDTRPIRRTARRQFMRDIRDKAAEIGIDQERIVLLERHVRKLYLEIHHIDADPEGSEFGPELDDEYVPTGPAKIQKRKRDVDNEFTSKFRRIKREFSEELLPGRSIPSHDVDGEIDTASVEDSAISVSEENSTARLDPSQETSSSEEESSSDELASQGPGVEEAAVAVKSADERLEHKNSSEMTPLFKGTREPSRSPEDAEKSAESTPQKHSSPQMPRSHATPADKIVVVIDSSSSKSSNADPVSDAVSNADKRKLHLEKKRMKRRNRHQAKQDQKNRESLMSEGTASSESKSKSQAPSRKTGKDTKKNSAVGRKTAFDDDYWDLTDF